MKILVISDSHGQLANLKHVLGFAGKQNIKAIIHCGDWDNWGMVEEALKVKIPLYTVLGNADIEPKLQNFSGDYLNLKLGGKKIGVVHRSAEVKKYFTPEEVNIVFCGHLHSSDDKIVSGIRVVRPGALIKGLNFAVYDTMSDKIEFFQDG
jgi:putative phosphoesterase